MEKDRGLTAVLLVLSAGYLASAFLITEPEGGYAVVGPRAFPVAIGLGLVACSLWVGLTATRFCDLFPVDWSGVALSAFVFLVYLSVLEPVGYLLTTTGFITLESRLLGSRALFRDLILSVFVTVSVYTVFNHFLGIRLPVGPVG